MLQKLPREILALVIYQFTNLADVKHISEACKSLYASSLPYLYESIVLGTSIGELDLKTINVKPLRAACEKGHLLYTRELKITSKFHRNLLSRCPHSNRHRFRVVPDNTEVDSYLLPLLEKLEDGKLRSLNWDLGICVPGSILGRLGYLPLRQPNLESLRLVMDGSCFESGIGLDFSSFPHLERLSLTGLCSVYDIASIARVLTERSHQIVELNLDFELLFQLLYDLPDEIDTTGRQGGELAKDYELLAELLGISGKQIQKFGALRVLSLAGVSFLTPGEDFPLSSRPLNYPAPHQGEMQTIKQISDIFDFSTIRTLKVRFCDGWQDLLDLLAKSPDLIRLQSLEIQFTGDHGFDEGRQLSRFLESFTGLETFFLSTHLTEEAWDTWQSLRRHRDTLRRFVYHGRGIHHPRYTQDRDEPNLSSYPEEIQDLLSEPLKTPLGELELTGFGLCCKSQFMTAIAQGFVAKNTLEVLHMRQSGPEFKYVTNWSEFDSEDDVVFNRDGLIPRDDACPQLGKAFGDFAQWVFGPKGILSLRLLAFGDFSYNGRFAAHNLLLCRMEQQPADIAIPESQRLYFRAAKADDRNVHELLSKHSDVLEACPIDSLFNIAEGPPSIVPDSEIESSISTDEWETFEESGDEEDNEERDSEERDNEERDNEERDNEERDNEERDNEEEEGSGEEEMVY